MTGLGWRYLTGAALMLALVLPARAAAAGAPLVGGGVATNVQGESVLLEAGLNPNGSSTTAHFEYVTQADYEEGGFTEASASPDSTLAAAATEKTETAELQGLTPSTSYRFRLWATNAAGEATGAEATFTTTAGFGIRPGPEGFAAAALETDESPDLRAGTHPDQVTIHLNLNEAGEFDGEPGVPHSDGNLRDLHVALPPGMLINPASVHECTQEEFHTPRVSPYEESLSGESCPNTSQVGVVGIRSSYGGGTTRYFGIYNLAPPFGSPGAIGFSALGSPVEITSHIRESDAAMVLDLRNLSQRLDVQGIELTLWGTPRDYKHDIERGNCLNEVDPTAYHGEPSRFEEVLVPGSSPPKYETVFIPGTCSTGNPKIFPPNSMISLPTSCQAPTEWSVQMLPWQASGAVERTITGPTMESCRKSHSVASLRLTTDSGASPTGLAFQLEINDGGGLLNEEGIVTSPTRKAVVSLPEGLTMNPSLGAGLGVCTEEQFANERLNTPAGSGCPDNSKIGDIAVEEVLGLPQPVKGSLYLAAPYDNQFHALIALYIVARDPERGIFEKAEGEVEPDPKTGRLKATFENLPRLHYTHFSLTFREGQRSAMVSPALCNTYVSQVELTPWSDPQTLLEDAPTFSITSGEGGGACSSGGARPFAPALSAGSLNPLAGAYTPFQLRMTRTDAEQEITTYSATFPPGLLAKIGGIPYCPDAAIERAEVRTGAEELEHPSCPAASEIGHTLAGYGLGGTLAYAPGNLYLAGPYKGAPISIVAVDSALVGPFDLGVVIVRSAIRIDPLTAQASIDSRESSPIPHILKGIPIHLRDIRVYIDRPNFMVNPTSCDALQTLSTLTGAGVDPWNPADDVSATSSDRYQLGNCGSLGFKPRLDLELLGPTRRGGDPALRATVRERPGDANIGTAVVTLPHSEFLAQSHIREICRSALFEADRCPADSVYGRARAFSPLLDEPLEGPVYLKSSSHPLPDLVAALRGKGGIAIDVEGRIDSFHGGMRARFEVLPDAPASKFVMTLFGGKKGLLENSEDVCARTAFASARFTGHNNALAVASVPLRGRCGKTRRSHHGHGRGKSR